MNDGKTIYQLLRNDSNSIGKYLLAQLDNAEQALFCIAFLKNSGLNMLKKHIEIAANNNCAITFYVGTDFYQTEPDALRYLLGLMDHHKHFNLFLISQSSTCTFHPKIFLLLSGKKATAVVGSSNLTGGGLYSNIEGSVCTETFHDDNLIGEIKRFFKDIENNKRCQRANLIAISQYERKYDIYRKRIRKAEKEAETEMDDILNLDAKSMQDYLKKYMSDNVEQVNWRKKIKNYAQARIVLDKLTNSEITSGEAFLAEYEKLVGKAGKGSLWHSGSIFRMKNFVASHYQSFLKMLKDLKQNIGLPPEEMFEIARNHFKHINGLGGNVVTEILNTYMPTKYPVLNKNPLSSLRVLGLASFPNQQSFKPETYGKYSELMHTIARSCHFKDLSQVDHFMNFIYWRAKAQ